MRRLSALAAVMLCGLALAACDRFAGKDAAGDKAFGERVRAYLLQHPEVLQEVAEKYRDKQLAEQAALERKARADLPKYRQALERDPRDFVANPGGSITVTEFYDYRCPHCVNVAPHIVQLIRDNPDIRFVFKEMPIFGPTSEHAARAAMAVKKDGGDYLGLYQAFMAARPLDDDAIDRIAQRFGARPGTLISTEAQREANAHIADTQGLFTALALGGTPAFIIGDDIVPGEDMDAVNAAIRRIRARSGATASAAPTGPDG